MPEITMSENRLPELKVGDVTLPGDLIDAISNLDIRERLAEVDLSSMRLPAVLRDVELPELHLPDVDLGAITRSVRPESRRRNLMPWLVVAGAATLFAGWWLATSSMTAPRVRDAAGKVRRRIDDMRGVSSDWTDLEEPTQTFWSTDSGWQETDSTGGTSTSDAAMAAADSDIIDADAAAAAENDGGGWSNPAAASHSLADASMGGTGFEGETGSADRGDAADREG